MNALHEIWKGAIPAIAYRKLSLRARVAVGLVCFERYCVATGLRHRLIDAFVQHMWELPCINSLPDWQSRGGELLHAALGDPLPAEILELLNSAGIEEKNSDNLSKIAWKRFIAARIRPLITLVRFAASPRSWASRPARV